MESVKIKDLHKLGRVVSGIPAERPPSTSTGGIVKPLEKGRTYQFGINFNEGKK